MSVVEKEAARQQEVNESPSSLSGLSRDLDDCQEPAQVHEPGYGAVPGAQCVLLLPWLPHHHAGSDAVPRVTSQPMKVRRTYHI